MAANKIVHVDPHYGFLTPKGELTVPALPEPLPGIAGAGTLPALKTVPVHEALWSAHCIQHTASAVPGAAIAGDLSANSTRTTGRGA